MKTVADLRQGPTEGEVDGGRRVGNKAERHALFFQEGRQLIGSSRQWSFRQFCPVAVTGQRDQEEQGEKDSQS